MLPILRVLTVIPLVVAAKIRREERRLIEWFRAREALDSSRAVTLPVDGAIARWVYERLIRRGVIKAAGERVYLEEAGYATYRRNRRHRAAVIIGLLLLGLAIAFFRGDVTL